MVKRLIKYYLIVLIIATTIVSTASAIGDPVFNNGQPEQDKVEISIFPNPAAEFFTINTNQKIQKITIHNIVGKELISYRSNEDNRYDLSDLRKGIYVVRVFGTDDNVIKAIRLSKS